MRSQARWWRVLGVGLALCAATLTAQAQEWPQRPVKLLVPSTPGSTPDVFARILAEGLRARLGQSIVVENKPGAGGGIAVNSVAKAAPDGYTLAISPPGPLGVNTLLYRKMTYDPATELSLVSLAVTQSNVLVVRQSLPVGSVKELVDLLHKEPGKYTYGSVGIGSINHLCMELIALNSKTSLTPVTYGGTPQAVMALLSGEVDMGCLPAQAVMPQVQQGKLKALAVATAARSAFMPDLPTLREAGVAGIEASAWMGVVAPAGTPAAVVQRLHREIAAVLQQPDTRSRLAAQLMEVVASSPEQFAATVREDVIRWKPVVETRKIQLE